MNENQDKDEEIELKEEVEREKQILEDKKNEEIALKRNKASNFRTENSESLEIMENEPFYRIPLTNIIESEDAYLMFVELPGLDKKHVKISLQGGNLELLGEKALKEKDKKEEKKDKEKKEKKDKDKKDKEKKEKRKDIKGDFLRREIKTTSFYRSFHIPKDISPEGIEASFKYGILSLKIPKKSAEISEKQEIEIK